MAECVILNADEGVTGMEGKVVTGMEGGVVRCGFCGLEEVKVLLAETRQHMQELRREVSVRSGTRRG